MLARCSPSFGESILSCAPVALVLGVALCVAPIASARDHVVANGCVEIALHEDGYLSRIRDAAAGEELLPAGWHGRLFSLVIRNPSNGGQAEVPFEYFLFQAASKEAEEDGAQSLEVSFKSYEYPRMAGFGYGGQIRVRVRISVPAEQNGLPQWFISVENSSTVEVLAVRFPILDGVQISEGGEDDQLVVTGEYFYRRPSAVRFPAVTVCRYAGQNMQWMDIHEPGRRGLYVASHDKSGRDTDLVSHGSALEGRVDLSIRKHVRILPGQTYDSPPYIVMPHRGDWHAAADIYNEWTSTWMREPSVPPWLANCDMLVTANGVYYIPFVRSLPQMAKMCADLGTPYLGVWFQGIGGDAMPFPHPAYTSEGALAEAIGRAHRMGAMVGFYINSQLYAVGATRGNAPWWSYVPQPPQALPPGLVLPTRAWVERNRVSMHNVPMPITWEKYAYIMRSSSSEWQEFLYHYAFEKYVKQYGADAIYFDQMGCDGPYRSDRFNGQRRYGEWGPGYVDLLKRLYAEALRVNPHFVTGQEGHADFTGQWVSWNLMGGHHEPRIFRYTFPRRVVFLIHGEQAQRYRKAFLMGCRVYGVPLEPRPGGGRVISERIMKLWALQRATKQLAYRARYRDTVGLAWSDRHLEARLLRYKKGRSNAIIVNILNNGGKQTLLSVSLSGKSLPDPSQKGFEVRAAWALTKPGEFTPLQGATDGALFRFRAPASAECSVLLVDELEPLIELPHRILVTTAGVPLEIPVAVRNLNAKPWSGRITWEVPDSWGYTARKVGPIPPGKASEETFRLKVPRAMAPELYDVYCVASGEGPTGRRWIGIRVVSPLDAKLDVDRRGRLIVELANDGPEPISGTVKVREAEKWKIHPASFEFTVPAKEQVQFRCEADGLLEPAWVDEVVASVIPGTEGVAAREAHLHVRPLVLNPGFERLVEGLPCGYYMRYRRYYPDDPDMAPPISLPSNIEMDAEVRYEGKFSLRIGPAGSDAQREVAQLGLPLKANTRYRLTVAIRRTTNHPGIFAAIRKDHGRQWYKAGVLSEGPLNQWQDFSIEFDTPQRAYWLDRSLDLWFMNESQDATAWFDAVRLQPIPKD